MSENNILVDLSNFSKASEFFNLCISGKFRVGCYGGAIRGGKTYNALATVIMLHKKYPGSRSIIVRDTLDTLRKNTYPTSIKAIPSNFIKHFKGDPQYEWTFTNGSQHFYFAEGYEKDKDYTRWDGLEVNFIILEQVEGLQPKVIEKALERAGSYVIPGAAVQPPPLVMMTVNPTQTWAKQLIYDRWKNETLPENWFYIPAYITDNPHIPQGYKDALEELKIVNPIKYERYVKGDWDIQDNVDDAFWHSFNYSEHVADLQPDFSQPMHISFDENVNPYPALSVWQICDKTLVQVHEICLRHPRNKLQHVASAFRSWAKSGGFDNMVYIYGDVTSNKEDVKLLRGQNFFTMLKSEISKDFHCQIRKPSKNPSVQLSCEFINAVYSMNFDGLRILINESCKESIKDYTNAQEASDGTMFKKKVKNAAGISYEPIGHFSDNKRYLITQACRDSYAKFRRSSSISEISSGGYEKERHY